MTSQASMRLGGLHSLNGGAVTIEKEEHLDLIVLVSLAGVTVCVNVPLDMVTVLVARC